MAYNTVPRRADGTLYSFEDPANPGTYIEIDELISGIDLSTAKTFADAPRLRDTGPTRKIVSTTEESNGEMTLNDTQGLSSTADFMALAELNAENLNMRRTQSTGRQIPFVVNLGGIKYPAEESGSVMTIAIPYTIVSIGTPTEV